MKKFTKNTAFVLFGIALLYVGLLLYPSILFSHNYEYSNCSIYSDRVIDEKIEQLIDEANNRVSKSDLLKKNVHFKIYICNDMWRMWLFSMGSTNAGAVVHYNFTRDIIFRPVDIKNNKIIPPDTWYFAKDTTAFLDRPLTYYIAHEMVHVLQSHFTNRGDWKHPVWLREGYADYIAKDGSFDFSKNQLMLRNNAPELDPEKGLYRYYHLLVAYLLDKKGMKIKDIYQNPPEEEMLKKEVLELPYVEE